LISGAVLAARACRSRSRRAAEVIYACLSLISHYLALTVGWRGRRLPTLAVCGGREVG
jgi:hypothetical protein